MREQGIAVIGLYEHFHQQPALSRRVAQKGEEVYMTTNEERMQVLKMIEKGQISAEEGARLLEAIEAASAKGRAEDSGTPPRWFRVRVTDSQTGKNKVNVNIPLGLVNVGMRMGAKFAPEMSGMDIEKMIQAIKEGASGKIIDVEDAEDGEHVEIYVE